MALEILVPTPGIRNLIREDKVHQIYSAMQTGQEKLGMQTMNQSLATLYFRRQISLETAISASSNRDELQEMINRGVGVVPGAGLGRARRLRAAALRRAVRVGSRIEGSNGSPPDRCTEERRLTWRRLRFPGEPAAASPWRASAWATRWKRSRRPCAASRFRSRASRRWRPRRRAAQEAARQAVPAKNLAVFTRQFSVMIDAGLPLVQCLDILGNQEEHKYFQQVILQTRTDVEGGQVAGRRDEAPSQGVRRALHAT